MNIASILPMIGTLILATGAGALGYVAINTKSEARQIQQAQVADPALQTASQQTRSLNLPSARPDVFYAAITDRPLFAPSRRPQSAMLAPQPVASPEPTPEVEPAGKTRPNDLTLSGILGQEANGSVLLTFANGESDWLRLNDQVDGWTINEIGSDWITLTAGEDSFRLELFE